jgi:hypothetical protein
VTAGQSTTFHLGVAAVGGAFQSPVVLSCANAPPGSTCLFSTPSVVPGSGSADVTITLTTTARSALLPVIVRVIGPIGYLAAIVLLLRGLWRLRRTAAMAAAVLAVAACHTSSSNNTPPGGVATVTLAPTSLTFPAQTVGTTSSPQAVTLTNTGSSDAAVANVSANGDFAATTTCGPTLASGASCAIALTFTPAAAGSRNGTLTVADNAAGSPHHVTLAGTGISPTAGTPTGTYQITIAGASGTLVHSVPVTLIVK